MEEKVKKDLKEQIEIMSHYLNGGEVEVKGKKEEDTEWGLCVYPIWDWGTLKYRIKEPKQKVTIEKWLCRNGQGDYAIIESTNVNQYKTYEKVKLMDIYEVEL